MHTDTQGISNFCIIATVICFFDI